MMRPALLATLQHVERFLKLTTPTHVMINCSAPTRLHQKKTRLHKGGFHGSCAIIDTTTVRGQPHFIIRSTSSLHHAHYFTRISDDLRHYVPIGWPPTNRFCLSEFHAHSGGRSNVTNGGRRTCTPSSCFVRFMPPSLREHIIIF